ncbi:hypothetical protein DPMN_078914 [Dreissena polymorpha]|uniref:Uncharacterized protein n=1 Tax=Dreissena polymorpha TaxID=45954 RepID=A0A9D4BPK4_DREPO|nr:hypothetical protein DPMN_078914 [Dreissena polymorpha]
MNLAADLGYNRCFTIESVGFYHACQANFPNYDQPENCRICRIRAEKESYNLCIYYKRNGNCPKVDSSFTKSHEEGREQRRGRTGRTLSRDTGKDFERVPYEDNGSVQGRRYSVR